jgi:predicted nucleic acid-binding protein
MSLVLDASLALAWVLPDEGSGRAVSVLSRVAEQGAIVPEVWPLEVANVLVVAVRRGRLGRVDVQRAVQALLALPIEVDQETHRHALGAVLDLAIAQELSAYDAAYLELARRRGLPVATLDARLSQACVAAGIGLV